jgi:hypothetical protein
MFYRSARAIPKRENVVMATIVKPAIYISSWVLVALSACSKLGTGQDEMTWARGALDRNERLQVVASDIQAKTFTVRLKDTGELRVVTLDQIVAGPPVVAGIDGPAKPATDGAATGSGASPEAPAQTSAQSGTPASQNAPAPGTAMTAAIPAHSSDIAAPPAEGNGSAGDQATPPSDGEGTADVQSPRAKSATNAAAGSVLASGPGYSIKASGSRGTVSRASLVTSARGMPVERLHDPIICQGSRLLHIDNRNLEFDGDAVNAEDGCEIHITNTHISAKGIGVLARAANVHIENSEIEGDGGSIEASDGAQVYAESSRFRGLTRRMEASDFHDLGGNVWN